MPRYLLLLFALLVIAATPIASAQETEDLLCGTTEELLASGGDDIVDGDTVRALVVLVKFRDDTYVPTDRPVDWPLYADSTQLPPFASGIINSSPIPATFSDSTLTRYYYEQSRPGAGLPGQHILYGDVHPEVWVSHHDNDWYFDDPDDPDSLRRGFGFLTKEVFDELFPADSTDLDYVYDPAHYDRNNDGYLDHVFVILRKTELVCPEQEPNCGNVAGQGTLHGLGANNGTTGGSELDLSYYSPSRAIAGQDPMVHVDWYRSGSYLRGLPAGRWAYRPHLHYLRVMAHEYGHDLWGPHLIQNDYNDVPLDVDSTSGANVYGLMATGFSQHDLAMAASERDDDHALGTDWIDMHDLSTSGTITLGDLYGSAEAATKLLSGVAFFKRMYLQNRQEVDYFNQVFETPVGDIGLLEKGLLVTIADNVNIDNHERDVIPASGYLLHPLEVGVFEGVMFGEDRVLSQLTPWTKPNSSGFFEYPQGAIPSWVGIDRIRPGVGVEVEFEYYGDYRTAPVVFIRNDSWMGAETDGTTFPNEVRVTNGATLTVEATTSLTFGGGIVVEDGASFIVEPGAHVTFGGNLVAESGASVVFEENAVAEVGSGYFLGGGDAALTFAEGVEVRLEERAWVEAAALTASGTASKPVVFTQATPGTTWDRILLKGLADFGHNLDHVRIEGAEVGLDLRTANDSDPRTYGAYVTNAELVGNAVGVSTDYVECSSGICDLQAIRARVSLDHVLVENSASYGLYLRNADFALGSSTVRNGGGHGVYVKNATATSFAENVIEGNGASGSGYDGLRVEANGAIDFSIRGDIAGLSGYNRIADNADKQVVYLSGGYLFMGAVGYGGDLNAVTESGTGCRVYNSSGSVLEAESNYWGTTSAPPASYFCGSHTVDVSPYLTYDPTGGSGGGYRTLPVQAPGGDVALASAAGPGLGHRGGEGDGDPVAWLRERIRATRTEVAGNPASASGPALVRLLAGLHRLDVRGETAEWPATKQALRRLRNRLAEVDPATLPPSLRRTLESALVVVVEAALAAGDYEEADALLTAFEPLVEGEEQALALGLNAVAVDEAFGRYDEALARLDGLITEVGDGHDGLGEDLAFMAEVIAAKADDGEDAGRGAGASADAPASRTTADATLPVEYALRAAYPNPTATRATVPFELPGAADVRIEAYDLLGRRVAVLADGRYEAGRHRAELDASGLGSGTYLVRAQLVPENGGVQTFTQKLTLVR